jgi:hypothetical protein
LFLDNAGLLKDYVMGFGQLPLLNEGNVPLNQDTVLGRDNLLSPRINLRRHLLDIVACAVDLLHHVQVEATHKLDAR